MNVYEKHNMDPLNQQAARILRDQRIPFDPFTELAILTLVRSVIEQNQLEIRAIPEPLLLVTKLQANPDLAMSLVTESEPGIPFQITLPPDIVEAAAVLLEEIIASLKATAPELQ
jgi:hypothetical protein